MVEIVFCPRCGAKEGDRLTHLFGTEPAIRFHGDYAECVRCAIRIEIPLERYRKTEEK